MATVTICPKFCSVGCEDERCTEFHICKFFALSDRCSNAAMLCRFGHELWDGGHNQGLLQQLMLDELQVEELRGFFRLPSNRTIITVPTVCTFYNTQDKCNTGPDACSYLHLCKYYVKGGNDIKKGGCKFNEDCRRNHDIESVHAVLKIYGICVDPPAEDILDKLRDLYRKVGVGEFGMIDHSAN